MKFIEDSRGHFKALIVEVSSLLILGLVVVDLGYSLQDDGHIALGGLKIFEYNLVEFDLEFCGCNKKGRYVMIS